MDPREIPIQNPCSADWSAMTGSSRRRHCRTCQKDVHDLSAMTEEEAAALLAQPPPEGLCVRYRVEPDGRVKHRARSGAWPWLLAAGWLTASPALAAPLPSEDAHTALESRLEELIEEAQRLVIEALTHPRAVEIPTIMGDVAPPPEVLVQGGVAPVLEEPPALMGKPMLPRLEPPPRLPEAQPPGVGSQTSPTPSPSRSP